MRRPNGSGPEDEPGLELARAHVQAGRVDAAEREYRKLILTRSPGERSSLRCEVADALIRFGRLSDAVSHLTQGLKESESPSAELLATVTMQNLLASCLQFMGEVAKAQHLIRFTPSLARALGEPRLQSMAAMTMAAHYAEKLSMADAAQECELAAKLGLHAGDMGLAARAWHRASTYRLQLGDLEGGLRLSDKALAAAKECEDLLTLTEVISLRVLMYQMQGRWARMQAELAEGVKVRSRLDQVTAEALYLTTAQWYVRAWQGDAGTFQELEAEVRTFRFPHPANEPARWIALAKLLAFEGRTEDARIELRHALEQVPLAPPDPSFMATYLTAAFNVADAICDVGDAPEARARYEHLKRFGHLLIPHVSPPLVLGRIASLSQQWDEAKQWLLDARQRAVQAGMAPFEALATYELGLLHERQHDRSQATPYFRSAAKSFDGLAMAYYRDQTIRHLDAMERARRPGSLTKREQQVFRLWALGKRVGEIASALIISKTTVRSHLQSAKGKTYVRNQGEALAWCLANGLITPDEIEPPIE